MVKNYRGINDDIALAIKYAKEWLKMKGAKAKLDRNVVISLSKIDIDLKRLDQLANAIKKRI